MPLTNSKSKAAFTSNLKAEMNAGKPQNTSLAIAYAVKRRAKKAHGGAMKSHEHTAMCAEGCRMAEGGQLTNSGYQNPNKQDTTFKPVHEQTNIPLSQALERDRASSAEMTNTGYQSMQKQDTTFKPAREQTNLDLSHQSTSPKSTPRADSEDERSLNQHGADEIGPTGTWMAEGGTAEQQGPEDKLAQVHEENERLRSAQQSPADGKAETFESTRKRYGGYAAGGPVTSEPERRTGNAGSVAGSFNTDNEQSDVHQRDMVGRIMQRRQNMYSEGGKVANDTEDVSDFMPNEFDDLALRDDLESSYTGANSGDEAGNAREDHDRRDVVARIMARRKKQTNPSPA